MGRAWWLIRRNALLANPRFQRWALRLPLVRGIARSHARRLFDLVAGFTYSQTLFACVELDLFRRIAEPVPLGELAAAVDLPVPAMERLIGAAEALGLVDRFGDGRVILGVSGAALVADPGIAAMVHHHRLLYADLADPLTMLRHPGAGALAGFWDYARSEDASAVAEYSVLMAASLGPVAEQLLEVYDFGCCRRVLDVGGGEGRFLSALRTHAPGLELGLFDLPAVTARARARLGEGVALHPGDFTRDALPPGYDVVTLIRVLHDHDDRIAAALLRSIRQCLPPGGRLVISEPMLDAKQAETVGATYFAFYLLAMGHGRARSAAQIGGMLQAAGFTRWTNIATPLPLRSGVIVAQV